MAKSAAWNVTPGTFYALSGTHPVWVVRRPVEVRGRLVKLKLALCSRRFGSREQGGNLFLIHRLEVSRGVQCLLNDLERIATGNHHIGRLAHGKSQAFRGC